MNLLTRLLEIVFGPKVFPRREPDVIVEPTSEPEITPELEPEPESEPEEEPKPELKEYPWMPIARSKLGKAEIHGPDANPEIVKYLHSTTLGAPFNHSDETPWCSAFVNWCVEKAGYKGTGSAWARSWLKWGKEADWDNVLPGSIVVLERGPSSGHVGFFVDADNSRVLLLGGNQGDKVSQAWFPMERILGIRVPNE